MLKNEEGGTEEDFDLPEDPKEGEEDKTDWKTEATKLREKAIAQREKTKAMKQKIADLEKSTPKPDDKKTGELDRIDRAVLRTEKITDAKEIELVQSIMKESGKDLESVLASKFFQTELKEMRELSATEDATPKGAKRSGTSTRDTVDYWLAKGELPPANEPELRRKVVNAKISKEKSGSQFSSNPIQ